ncbi:MAG: glycosyltransferase family 4 protein [Methanoregula sp.]
MTRRIHICHVTLGHNPTDDRIFHKEAHSLAKLGYDVTIIAPAREVLDEKDGIKFVLFQEKGFFHNILQAYRLARRQHADVYHYHDFDFLLAAILWKYKFGRKIIYDAHETIFWLFMESSRRPLAIRLPLAILAQIIEWANVFFADRVITVTPWIAEGFKRFRKNVTLIYNFPQAELFRLPDTSDKNKPIILYHGHISPTRNIEMMIESMKYVHAEFPSARLVFIGDIDERYSRQLTNFISLRKLTDVIEVHPAIPFDQIPKLVASATIGLSSMNSGEALKRSIQIKPFEFMAAGIPVLGCRIPSIEQFVERTGAGIIIDPLTAENLGRQISILLANDQLRHEMGSRGKRAVAEKFNWRSMEVEIEELYRYLWER